MRPTVAEVLTQLDVPEARAVAVLEQHDAPLPWYVRALTGALGWAAAGSFLATVHWTTPAPVRLGIGLGALVVALLLRRRFTRGFFGHLALALALFGEALAIAAFEDLGVSRTTHLTFAIGVEVALVALYRDSVVRFMSVVAAWAFALRLYQELN